MGQSHSVARSPALGPWGALPSALAHRHTPLLPLSPLVWELGAATDGEARARGGGRWRGWDWDVSPGPWWPWVSSKAASRGLAPGRQVPRPPPHWGQGPSQRAATPMMTG